METTEYRAEGGDDLQELYELLHRIVLKITRQTFTTPRLTQIDVGQALSLVHRVDYPRAFLIQRALADLLRELGKKRPDLYRYIITLEDAVHDLEAHMAGRK